MLDGRTATEVCWKHLGANLHVLRLQGWPDAVTPLQVGHTIFGIILEITTYLVVKAQANL